MWQQGETATYFAVRRKTGRRGGRSRRKHTRKASSWRLEGDAESERKRKEVGNESQESGREALRRRKGRRESKWDMQILNFQKSVGGNKEHERMKTEERA